jgi:organic radical activating enzyme
MKFKYLKIDLESKTTYTCHAAEPHTVDFVWLSENRGELFNNPINVGERQQMLSNQRNSSCERNCWAAEDRGAVSPRMFQDGIEQTHTKVVTAPETIDLTIGADCNLTCTYCCKEFSSAWRRDIADNGQYHLGERFALSSKDKLLLAIKQPVLKQTHHYQLLLDEIKYAAPGLRKLTVTGGEPFLDNGLIDTIKSLPLGDAVIDIYTGLGVSVSRFSRIVEELQGLPVVVIVSAETIGKMLEFNRYGIRWDEFQQMIELLRQKNIKFRFQSTISNLTIHGHSEFLKYFGDDEIVTSLAYQPVMMSPWVLDPDSKEVISKQAVPRLIKDSIVSEPTEEQRADIRNFLIEFTRRRTDLSLSIFPESFLKWLGLHNVVQ